MNNRYRCDICGCYLDPGEGLLCDECRQELRERAFRGRRMQESIREREDGQIEMSLQEVG